MFNWVQGENGKVSIRNVRKDTNDSLKKLKGDGVSEDAIKGGEEEVQKLTDAHVAKIAKYSNLALLMYKNEKVA